MSTVCTTHNNQECASSQMSSVHGHDLISLIGQSVLSLLVPVIPHGAASTQRQARPAIALDARVPQRNGGHVSSPLQAGEC